MAETLTAREIRERYPDEWVLVGEPEYDANMDIVRGKVLAHSADRDALDAADLALRPRSAAHLYTGAVPKDIAFIL